MRARTGERIITAAAAGYVVLSVFVAARFWDDEQAQPIRIATVLAIYLLLIGAPIAAAALHAWFSRDHGLRVVRRSASVDLPS